MRLLVSGGRTYDDVETLEKVLERIDFAHCIDVLIEGGQKRWDKEQKRFIGLDHLAGSWARRRGVPNWSIPADWDRYGKAAGYRRNHQMLHECSPDVLLPFPGGPGTADMTTQCWGVIPIWNWRDFI
ncbi:DUF2493 domain-containing protein [Methylobacterium indicum]|uniref:YspA cpYpsA-related SLOG domain-containing protein n=1 Tax=Methylobacterium indicum TaxID=1775910 RepID=A0A8H9CAW9_9HYPH|nr:DUF2493 domain-containing protein [Methylobacterium indicum]BCM87875.1 hypothetical protein mvi_63360 [Methylobacterium indicum]